MPKKVPSKEQLAYVEALVRDRPAQLKRFKYRFWRTSSQEDPHALAEDASQDVYANLLRSGNIANADEPLAYLRCVTNNVIAKVFTRRKRDPMYQSLDIDGALEVPDSGAEEVLDGTREEQEQQYQDMEAAIGRLTEVSRAFIELNMRGMSARKIGLQLGISRHKANRLLAEAKEELKQLIHQESQGRLPK